MNGVGPLRGDLGRRPDAFVRQGFPRRQERHPVVAEIGGRLPRRAPPPREDLGRRQPGPAASSACASPAIIASSPAAACARMGRARSSRSRSNGSDAVNASSARSRVISGSTRLLTNRSGQHEQASPLRGGAIRGQSTERVQSAGTLSGHGGRTGTDRPSVGRDRPAAGAGRGRDRRRGADPRSGGPAGREPRRAKRGAAATSTTRSRTMMREARVPGLAACIVKRRRDRLVARLRSREPGPRPSRDGGHDLHAGVDLEDRDGRRGDAGGRGRVARPGRRRQRRRCRSRVRNPRHPDDAITLRMLLDAHVEHPRRLADDRARSIRGRLDRSRSSDYLRRYLTPDGDLYRPHQQLLRRGRPGARVRRTATSRRLWRATSVESASGMPFDAWCDERIFAPLGDASDELAPGRARPVADRDAVPIPAMGASSRTGSTDTRTIPTGSSARAYDS